jgi:BirA family biotin operon repressor/biotin-[acetyl-CoA-carboxylase] ligase
LPLGWRLEYYATIGSTNDEARQRAMAGDPGRLWIVADEQTKGRGRLGRIWASPRGNLHASALLIDPAPVTRASEIGFVAGLALHRAVADLGGRDFFLKWPNDLVWRGAKVAGLLAEGVTLPDGGFACAMGIGVNCAVAPEGAPYPVDCLSNALDRTVAPAELFERLAQYFAEALATWSAGEGFAEIRAAWLKVAAGLGAPIRISGANSGRSGVFETIDSRGRLLLRRDGRLEIVEAADVNLLDEQASGDGARKAAG